jgi:hypothetical protein
MRAGGTLFPPPMDVATQASVPQKSPGYRTCSVERRPSRYAQPVLAQWSSCSEESELAYHNDGHRVRRQSGVAARPPVGAVLVEPSCNAGPAALKSNTSPTWPHIEDMAVVLVGSFQSADGNNSKLAPRQC